MPTHVPLPEGLGPHFTLARGRELGVGVGRLRGPDLTTSFHGARSVVMAAPSDSPGRRGLDACRAFTPLMKPHHLFTHTTAALLWGCPLPRRFEIALPLHVTSLAPARALTRRHVVGHRLASDRVTVCRRFGLPVADPATTFLGLATFLELDDLVAAAAHLILEPVVQDPGDLRPYIDIDSLQVAIAAASGRGARNAASAGHLMRARVESPRETSLRLVLLRAGLPEPEINPDLYSDSGQWLGRGDLVFRRWKVLVEYDGDHHRTDIRQYEKDIARVERFVADGWIHLRVRTSGLGAGSATTVRRVTAALTSRGWRP